MCISTLRRRRPRRWPAIDPGPRAWVLRSMARAGGRQYGDVAHMAFSPTSLACANDCRAGSPEQREDFGPLSDVTAQARTSTGAGLPLRLGMAVFIPLVIAG